MRESIFKIADMTCTGCEKIIENSLRKLDGVSSIKTSYKNGNAIVSYDEKKCSDEKIADAIENAGYTLSQNKSKIVDTALIFVIIAGIYIIVNNTGLRSIFQYFPVAREGMGYAAVFTVGLLTSIHCVAMCGGINITASIGGNQKTLWLSALLYNIGRIVSYTIIGGLLGGIGSVIAISQKSRAVIGIIAGVFMIIMGINMLGGFGITRKLSLRMPVIIRKKLYGSKNHGAFYIGLINGFMPCGPLQSLQLLAVAKGSVFGGAFTMLCFSLGTVPLMLLFGGFAGVLTKRFKGYLMTASVALIVIFGLFMIQNNLSLTGFNIPSIVTDSDVIIAQVKDNKQYIEAELKPGSYDSIQVKNGIPVEWNIKADSKNINGCNNEIVIPQYSIDYKLKEGENIIEFTPDKEGEYSFSCWMGMIKGRIKVIE